MTRHQSNWQYNTCEVIQCIAITAAGHRIPDTRADFSSRPSSQALKLGNYCAYCIKQFYCFFMVVIYLFQIKHAGVGLTRHRLALSRLNISKEKWVIIMWFGYSALSDSPANLIHTHTLNEGTSGSRSITPLCPAQLGQHTLQTAALAGTAELLPAQFSLINSELHNTQLPACCTAPLYDKTYSSSLDPLPYSLRHADQSCPCPRGRAGEAFFCVS